MGAIKLVAGGGVFWSQYEWTEGVEAYLDMLTAHGIKEIDSAQAYGDSELVLGNNGATKRFDISTKVPGAMSPGSFRREEFVSRTRQSLERLQATQFDILYLHAPDPSIPIEETLSGVQELYAAGAFRRFGISNYKADEVRLIYDHQRRKGWVLPTVYQGNYNPVARNCEADLIPTLKNLNISFYAFGPAAGGFLTKTKQQILDGAGRFSKTAGGISDIMRVLYDRPSLVESLEVWHGIAEDAGCSPYNLAIRWVVFNSVLKPENGDAAIVGAGSTERLQAVFNGVKQGPLPHDIVQRIDSLWETVSDEAPDYLSVVLHVQSGN